MTSKNKNLTFVTFSVLDVDGIEPLLDVIEHGHWDGGDHHDLLGVVLEDEAHVEVLQLELNALEVNKLNVLKSDDHRRLEKNAAIICFVF